MAQTKVTINELDNSDGEIAGVWKSWTPTLANLSGGTLSQAKYTIIGKTCHVKFKYTLGGAGVAGGVTVTYPVPESTYTANQPVGTCILRDANVGFYVGTVLAGDGYFALYPINAAGTTAITSSISSTAPFTWASTDLIMFTATYEIA